MPMAAKRSSVQVLAVNAGSSSLKLGVYEVSAATQETVGAPLLACIEGLEPGGQPRLSRPGLADQSLHLAPATSFMDALGALLPWLDEVLDRSALGAVAHRVVHGGGLYRSAVQVDKSVLAKLRRFESLAPLHQPHHLNALQIFASHWSELPQIACFDTAFHADLPTLEVQFALPELPELQGVRRYGFHGLSYDYVSRCLI
jgi:acetate kinase